MKLLSARRSDASVSPAKKATRLDRGRVVLGLGVALMIAVHGFWPHAFKIDEYSLALVGVLLILALHQLLRSAKLPGLGALEFRDEFRAGEKAAQRVQATRTDTEPAEADEHGSPHSSIEQVHALF